MSVCYNTNLKSLVLIHQGKVRDIYEVDDKHMLIITTDRLSAFDVILPTPIPKKGEILTAVSNLWFKKFESLIPNHLSTIKLENVITDKDEYELLKDRSIIVKKVKALPIEAIVRGYIIGSGWKDYQKNGEICGIKLQPGLQLAEKLPEAIYTPSSKAAVGDHDENISFNETVNLVGKDLAEQIKQVSIQLYSQASEYALERGIIIADTKFEFGVDETGQLILIDEAITPDSSRFWDKSQYKVGVSPNSYDKQYVRDYLENLVKEGLWNKEVPGPELPDEIIENTSDKYLSAWNLLKNHY
ncbi:MAG: phosphoribosylaminoimidazolesuccinocarboxamide synthase [Gammaproteobacteria bacterium]|nr:phosphoribosylaminoimidazolesuccinocarboxamide synthase [Gammaproteobacteria bacterium]